MQILISVLLAMAIVVAFLVLNHIIYKREKDLLEINASYRNFNRHLFDELFETRKILGMLNNERDEYRAKMFDFIEHFNATYSNTKLHFDEDKRMIVINDVDTDDEMPAEEEIMQHGK